MHLTKTKLAGGVPAWAWRDPNGQRWFLYRSFGRWRYCREDDGISSVGYSTLGDAKEALERSFEETPNDPHD